MESVITVYFAFFQIEKQNMSGDIETGTGFISPCRRFLSGILSTVFLQSLTLTFLAEWGDRSQIATIILGAREVSLTDSKYPLICQGRNMLLL